MEFPHASRKQARNCWRKRSCWENMSGYYSTCFPWNEKKFQDPPRWLGNTLLPRNLGSRAGDTLWIYVIRCYFSIPKCEPTKWNSKSKIPKRCGLFLLNIGVHIWKCSSIFSPKRIPGGHPSRFTTRAWLRLHSHRLFDLTGIRAKCS